MKAKKPTQYVGLPVRDQKITPLSCGCTKTWTDHGNGFRITEIEVMAGCTRHDPSMKGKRPQRPIISQKVRFAIMMRDGFACRYCGKKSPDVELEVDHIVAVARGGLSDPGNLITACVECNRGKSHTALEAPL